jgi:cytochrome c553
MLHHIALLLAVGCSTAPAPGTPEHGAQTFDDLCAPCHGGGGEGNAEIGAPSIAGLPTWYVEAQLHKFREGVRGTHFDDIAGMRMRPMSKALTTDAELAAVSAHVGSLPAHRPAATLMGDAAAGKALYVTCTACHQADGKGNQVLSAPSLLVQPDWYLVHQLDNFKKGLGDFPVSGYFFL